MKTHHILQGFAVGLWLALPVAALAQNGCGGFNLVHYGPYDYRTHRQELVVVDKFHFAPQVEALIAGQSSYLGGDLNYVLLASPNHHRALVSMSRLSERLKNPQPEGAEFTIDCYWDRAVRYAPDDIVVRGLYAQYLNRRGRKADAIKQLEAATRFAKDDGFSYYNIGLVYFELGAYEPALESAWRAEALGFERDELAAMLKKANKWRDPPPEVVAAAASAASTAAAESAAASEPR